MTDAEQHFNRLASGYDYWKSKNQYYYDALKGILRAFIPKGSRVLEIGCGTGDVLLALSPREGKGIDISEEMIVLAKKRHSAHPELSFERVDLLNGPQDFPHDYLFMTDVLEHVRELPAFLDSVAKGMAPGSHLIITLANPRWEWLLMLTEKLGMKMPEGPHWRLSIKENEVLYRRAGLSIAEKGYRLLIPKRLPFSDWINERFYRSALLAPWGFIVFWVLTKPSARPAVFLDRDGVINQLSEHGGKIGPPAHLGEFKFLPQVIESCAKLKKAGFVLVVATNQPDVGRGTLSKDAVEAMHAFLIDATSVDRIEACYHPGRGESNCDCRKPLPGMLMKASQELGLDLAQSWMVGDRFVDVACGRAAGTRTILVGDGYGEEVLAEPDFRARDLAEAVEIILSKSTLT